LSFYNKRLGKNKKVRGIWVVIEISLRSIIIKSRLRNSKLYKLNFKYVSYKGLPGFFTGFNEERFLNPDLWK